MKKNWNSLLQKWTYELEPTDISCVPDAVSDVSVKFFKADPFLHVKLKGDLRWIALQMH